MSCLTKTYLSLIVMLKDVHMASIDFQERNARYAFEGSANGMAHVQEMKKIYEDC